MTGEHAVPETKPLVRLLLVDDRPENLLALEAILEPLGTEMVRATSGDEALRRLLSEDFAVILLDVQMPGLNGFETARLIKARERSKYIPIIFLTAISKEEQYVFEGYSVGAVDYLFKPFNPDILRSKVSVFVDLYEKQQQLAEQEARLHESERRELELRHMRELWESEARLGEVVGSAMDAIVMFGPDERVLLFNAAAERMFRCPASEAIGGTIRRFFPPEVSADAIERACGAANTPEPESDMATGHSSPNAPIEAFLAKRASGDVFPVEASVSCLETRGEPSYTLIVRDVSERRTQEAALRDQALSIERASEELRITNDMLRARSDELERAMSARSRFYASMSHELRTPINAVLGYSTLLLEDIYGPLNDKQREGIQRTHKAAKHLLELVNDVLDLSKIEAGKIDLRLQPVEFPSLVEDLFVTVRPLADEHGSALSLEHVGEKPVTIISDPRRLRQILLNLLSNAIKFGKGKPIRVRSLPQEDGGVVIEVADEGPGIAPEDQERIFHEFVQLGKSQLQEGTGLGLPISRRLAALLDGALRVVSHGGDGSVFQLSLPANTSPRPSRAIEQELGTGVASETTLPVESPTIAPARDAVGQRR